MFSIPYQDSPYKPYWGPITAQANFCEEDYIITPYIAEVVSTLTSASYIYYAAHGIRSNKDRPDAFLRYLPYFGLAAVGIFSTIFHATLTQHTQWFDDLSMHIANTTVLHRAYTFDKSTRFTVISGIALTVLMTSFAIFHCWTDEFLLHTIIFGSMIAAVGIKTRQLISTRVKSPIIGQQVSVIVAFGAITFIGGFLLWNLDNMLCPFWINFRRSIGMPWSFVFELHGWWHLLTGVGAYTFMALVEYLTSSEAGQPLSNGFAWPIGKIVDMSVGKPEKMNGHHHVNGNGTNGKATNGKTK